MGVTNVNDLTTDILRATVLIGDIFEVIKLAFEFHWTLL